MGRAIDGGCQCGIVRYRLEGEPLGVAVCHCIECQRQSGSAFGMSLAVPSGAFKLLSGALKTFDGEISALGCYTACKREFPVHQEDHGTCDGKKGSGLIATRS
jgi:hypothetical protein